MGWVITSYELCEWFTFLYSTLEPVNRIPARKRCPCSSMGLLPDKQNCGLRMHRECRERFPRHRELATCITARASRTCRDAWRDRSLAVSFVFGSGKNVPGIPGACATHNFAYLVRGPYCGWRKWIENVVLDCVEKDLFTFLDCVLWMWKKCT